MTKFFAVLSLALVPVLSLAKIGDKKADYEAATASRLSSRPYS